MEDSARMLPIIAAVPLKPFAAAKGRLAATLSVEARRRISQELATRTIAALRDAGAAPLVLAADDEVEEWARRQQIPVTTEQGSSLNGAAQAAAATAAAADGAWLICHADLPLIGGEVVSRVVTTLASGRPIIAPSADGGTNLLGAALSRFDFAYGTGSYHHHLRRLTPHQPLILVHPALAIDLDQPADWQALASRLPWLAQLGDTLAAS